MPFTCIMDAHQGLIHALHMPHIYTYKDSCMPYMCIDKDAYIRNICAVHVESVGPPYYDPKGDSPLSLHATVGGEGGGGGGGGKFIQS